jgi:HSP20 family molecular chaperone IbpA
MTLTEPVAASWLRDLTRYLATGPGAGGFFPPADVLVTDEDVSLRDGVLTLRIRKPEPLKPQRIEIGGPS